MTYNYIPLQNRDTFTASTAMQPMSPGRYIDYLSVYIKGDMPAGSAVSVANFMALLNPFEVFLKGSPCVQVSFEDAYALNVLLLGKSPFSVVATAATDDQTKVGVMIPLWQPPRVSGELKYRATRVAVSGVDTETLTVFEASNTKTLMPKYLHYVTMPMTTAGATGYGNRVELGTIPGELEGLLLRSATVPTTSAETATIQQVDLYANEVKIGTREWRELAIDAKNGYLPLFASPADCTILDNYRLFNMTFDPLRRGTNVRLDIDAQATSSAARITPVYVI